MIKGLRLKNIMRIENFLLKSDNKDINIQVIGSTIEDSIVIHWLFSLKRWTSG